MLMLLFCLFSSCVIVRLQDAPNGKPEESETTTIIPTTVTDDVAELKRQDWDVWCKLQPNGNDCAGNGFKTTRYYYDTNLEDCKTFMYGQCSAAFNNFNTLSECHESCRENGPHPLKKPFFTEKVLCRLQPSFGLGYGYYPMYYFDINTKKCKGFSYSGVGGNGNRFPNSQICSTTCLKLMEPELE